MCGIFGILSKNINKGLKGKICRQALQTLKHRGPDDKGFYQEEQVSLCHTRLSIIDLKKGKQPMVSDNGNLVLIFNGEIVNFKNLKKKLINQGIKFNTNSDTEIIIKMYEKYEKKMLNYLNGMFAFSIWDKKKKKLFLARDQLGIKPLYYSYKDKNFFFSSELETFKDISRLMYNSYLEKNNSLYDEFLVFGNLAFKNTLYKDIYSLPPGHYLEITEKELILKNYIKNNLKQIEIKKFSEKQITNKLSNLLETVIKEWSISDVKTGILLSSGLDSNLINQILEKKKNIEKFTVIFPDSKSSINENEILRRNYNIDIKKENIIKIFDKDIPNNLEKLITKINIPIQNFNSITFMKICEFIKKKYGLKVFFTGDGADEIFGGYQRHWSIAEKFKITQKKSSIILANNYLSIERMRLFSKKLNLRFFERKKIFNELLSKNAKNKILEFDQKSFLPGYLDRADKIGMMHGQEVRVPFCDYRIVNFVNNIPWDMKIRNGNFKNILRQVAEKYLPKDQVWNKDKYKFNLPIVASFKNGKLNEMFKDLITSKSKISNYYNYKGCLKLLENHQNLFQSKNDHSNTLARILSLEIWLRNC